MSSVRADLRHGPHGRVTLGELRDYLEYIPDSVTVVYDDGGSPTTINSWRGVYAMPALGHDHGASFAGDLLKEIEACLAGKVYYGWKGGKYTYSASDGLWRDNPGNVSEVAIVGATYDGYRVTLLTEKQDA